MALQLTTAGDPAVLRAATRARRPAPAAALLLCLCLSLALAAAASARDLRVYRSKHRPAAELLPIAEALLGEQGSAVADPGTNSLVLAGPPALLDEVVGVLDGQDRAPKTVVLHYESTTLASLRSDGLNVDWGFSNEHLRVGTAPRRRRSGVTIHGEAARVHKRGELAGTLRLLDGHRGRIETGRSVPVWIRTRAGVASTVLSAVSGFEVEPRVLGDGKVRLELSPYDERLETGGALSLAGAATTLVVEPGERVVVGGLGRAASADSADLLSGAAASDSSEERVLLITAEVE